MRISADILFFNINNTNQTKYLNIACDVSRVGGGGCALRESYCSYKTCICKPEFPINVEDVMCVDRYKKVGEICSIDAECETNSYCVKANDNYKLKRCVCRQGFSFSQKFKTCIKGHKGSLCSTNADCTGPNNICSQSKCLCDYGYDWIPKDEQCYKKSRHGESCESTENCRVYDKLSECHKDRKVCICRQSSMSQMNAIDVLTQKCILCPSKRFNNVTKVCSPETLEIEYKSYDRSAVNRNSLQYVYIALSISPFVVFAIIGFLYKFVSPRNYGINNFLNSRHTHNRNVYSDDSIECHIPNNTRIDSNSSALLVNLSVNDSHAIICPPVSPALFTLIPPRDPPPTYEASQQMPPSYEEAIAASQT